MWGRLPQPVALAQRSHLAGYIALGYHGVALDEEPLDNAKLGFTGNHRWSILVELAAIHQHWNDILQDILQSNNETNCFHTDDIICIVS